MRHNSKAALTLTGTEANFVTEEMCLLAGIKRLRSSFLNIYSDLGYVRVRLAGISNEALFASSI